jgi:Ca2+-binding EF-hand superfamily protein
MQHSLRRGRIAAFAILAMAAAFSTTAARAETADDMSFSGMVEMKRIDKNKDGMVSRAEFLESMGKVWDMKMRQMKLSGERMTEKDFQQILMYLRAGG